MNLSFEYHQKLHHSQTMIRLLFNMEMFEYHQKLHHSQTYKQGKL